MILAIDIGNSNIVFGLFESDKLLSQARISTEAKKTADEYGILIASILKLKAEVRSKIRGVIISSVVPPLTPVFSEMSKAYFDLEPIMVGPGLKTGLSIGYDDPRQVGADRVVNAVAAEQIYGAPCIIVDFGTAVTFCAVDGKKNYRGGAIFPGLKTAYDALADKAARLPRIGLAKPGDAIGKSTESSMVSGMIYGYAGMIDGIVRRFKNELDDGSKVIGTGGMIEHIAPYTESVDIVDINLTLKGLLILYTMNHKKLTEMSGMQVEKPPA